MSDFNLFIFILNDFFNLMPEFASKCLDDVLEESNIPITPDSINGVWELIPDDSGSLLEVLLFP